MNDDPFGGPITPPPDSDRREMAGIAFEITPDPSLNFCAALAAAVRYGDSQMIPSDTGTGPLRTITPEERRGALKWFVSRYVEPNDGYPITI
jgi:hypothetical protein